MEQMGAFLPLILIFGVFYILLIRPQQKKVKLHREMINNLKRGDSIITTGGIIGTISKVKDTKELIIKISEDVEIQLAPGMIHDLYSQTKSPKETSNQSKQTGQNEQKKGLLTGIFNKKNN
tara:strand:- start:272 stop:634 length:363 start_codon:yes stop_codon:yes gene_type:complete